MKTRQPTPEEYEKFWDKVDRVILAAIRDSKKYILEK